MYKSLKTVRIVNWNQAAQFLTWKFTKLHIPSYDNIKREHLPNNFGILLLSIEMTEEYNTIQWLKVLIYMRRKSRRTAKPDEY